MRKDVPNIGYVAGPEYGPRNAGKAKSGSDPQGISKRAAISKPNFSEHRVAELLGRYASEQINAIQCSPENKCPVCSMPKSANCKCDQDIPEPQWPTHATATQGQVNVIPEPRGKRNMPALPEFRNGL